MSVPEGWFPASNPPDTDRTVLMMLSDGYTELGFYDTVSGEEEKGGKWWRHPIFGNPIEPDRIIGWKEI